MNGWPAHRKTSASGPDCGLSPKEIDRSLGMRPTAISDLVRKLAAERDANSTEYRTRSTACSTPDGAPASRSNGHPEWQDPGADDGNRWSRHRARRPQATPPTRRHGVRLPARRLLPRSEERDGTGQRQRPSVAPAYRPRVQRLQRAAHTGPDRAPRATSCWEPPSTPKNSGSRHTLDLQASPRSPRPLDPTQRDHVRTQLESQPTSPALRQPRPRPSHPAPRGRAQRLQLHHRARPRRTAHDRLRNIGSTTSRQPPSPTT